MQIIEIYGCTYHRVNVRDGWDDALYPVCGPNSYQAVVSKAKTIGLAYNSAAFHIIAEGKNGSLALTSCETGHPVVCGKNFLKQAKRGDQFENVDGLWIVVDEEDEVWVGDTEKNTKILKEREEKRLLDKLMRAVAARFEAAEEPILKDVIMVGPFTAIIGFDAPYGDVRVAKNGEFQFQDLYTRD